MVKRLPLRCPYCDGTYMVDDGINKCVSCSRTLKNYFDMAKYYEHNKAEILAEFKRSKSYKTSKKLLIPPSTLHTLIKRWTEPQAVKEPRIQEVQTVDDVPTLPKFSSEWPESVQLLWLEIFWRLNEFYGKKEVESDKDNQTK